MTSLMASLLMTPLPQASLSQASLSQAPLSPSQAPLSQASQDSPFPYLSRVPQTQSPVLPAPVNQAV